MLLGRAMGLGGTSVLWGGQLAEFEEKDLIRQEISWPLAYLELRRWYDDVYENVLGISDRPTTNAYWRTFGGGKVEKHTLISNVSSPSGCHSPILQRYSAES